MGFLEIAIFGRKAHQAMNVTCGDRVIINRPG
jgi:putative ubiquitin-RnfH superfamily antitoxin RatB of RatAB toxin-antitoxin module